MKIRKFSLIFLVQHLDKIINLQKFWSETISEVNKGAISLHMYGYEIGEICNLYRQWLDIDDPNLLIDQETIKGHY